MDGFLFKKESPFFLQKKKQFLYLGKALKTRQTQAKFFVLSVTFQYLNNEHITGWTPGMPSDMTITSITSDKAPSQSYFLKAFSSTKTGF